MASNASGWNAVLGSTPIIDQMLGVAGGGSAGSAHPLIQSMTAGSGGAGGTAGSAQPLGTIGSPGQAGSIGPVGIQTPRPVLHLHRSTLKYYCTVQADDTKRVIWHAFCLPKAFGGCKNYESVYVTVGDDGSFEGFGRKTYKFLDNDCFANFSIPHIVLIPWVIGWDGIPP